MTVVPFIRPLPASQQQMTRQQFVLNEFAGGINNVDNETTIADNQVVDAENMVFTDNKTVEKRWGTTYEYEAKETDTNYNQPITWYDVYKCQDGTSHVITASDEKIFVDDEYVCNVNGRVKGVNFNGSYFFVDTAYLNKLEYENEEWVVYKFIEDPKFYIESFPKEFFTVATVNAAKDTYDFPLEDELYNPQKDYYSDPYGAVKLEHGDEPGMVNADNYYAYYVKTTTVVTERQVSVSGVGTDVILPNVFEGDYFKLGTNEIESKIIPTITNEIDAVTGLVHSTITTETVHKTFQIQEINTETRQITFTEVISIHESEIPEIFKKYDTFDTDNEKKLYMQQALTERFGGLSCKCYEPRDNTYNDGELFINDDHYVWYQPCQNELEYAYLGENCLPSNPRNICVYKNRLCTTGDYGYNNEVRMSNINVPYYFPAAISFGLDPNGDIIQDVFEFDGALIIGRHQDIYALYGVSATSSSDSFNLQKLDSTTGIMSANCGAIINNFYLFLGFDGKLYKMTTPTTNVQYLMTRPLTTFIDLFKAPFSLTREHMKNVSTIAYNGHVYWSIGDKIIIYSYDTVSFTYFTGWNAKSLFTNGIDIYFGDEYGNRCKWTKGVYNDCGKAIKSRLQTKTHTMNNVNYKYFEQLLMTLDRYQNYNSSVKIQVDMDNRKRIKVRLFECDVDTTAFGTTTFGEEYAALPYQKTNWLMLNFRSRSISIIFSNDIIDETFKVIDCSIIYTSRDIR